MNRQVYTLTDWSFVKGRPNPYLAPEVPNMELRGKVYGHSRHEDGHLVDTSRIIGWNGRDVKTSSGSTYRLTGDPDPNFVKFLEDAGEPPLDPDKPLG